MVDFVKRIGVEEVSLVAEFYLTHSNAYYANTGHSVGAMLRDAEKLRTEWATGQKITASQTRETERKQHNLSVYDKLIETSRRMKNE